MPFPTLPPREFVPQPGSLTIYLLSPAPRVPRVNDGRTALPLFTFSCPAFSCLPSKLENSPVVDQLKRPPRPAPQAIDHAV